MVHWSQGGTKGGTEGLQGEFQGSPAGRAPSGRRDLRERRVRWGWVRSLARGHPQGRMDVGVKAPRARKGRRRRAWLSQGGAPHRPAPGAPTTGSRRAEQAAHRDVGWSRAGPGRGKACRPGTRPDAHRSALGPSPRSGHPLVRFRNWPSAVGRAGLRAAGCSRQSHALPCGPSSGNAARPPPVLGCGAGSRARRDRALRGP